MHLFINNQLEVVLVLYGSGESRAASFGSAAPRSGKQQPAAQSIRKQKTTGRVLDQRGRFPAASSAQHRQLC